jgi:hypothetical protein
MRGINLTGAVDGCDVTATVALAISPLNHPQINPNPATPHIFLCLLPRIALIKYGSGNVQHALATTAIHGRDSAACEVCKVHV